jgi:hypothetical protein
VRNGEIDVSPSTPQVYRIMAPGKKALAALLEKATAPKTK